MVVDRNAPFPDPGGLMAKRKFQWRKWKGAVGAVTSALLLVGAFPGSPFPLFVWVCLVPWLVALRGCPALRSSLYSLLFSALVWLGYLWQPFYESALTIAHSAASAAALTALHQSGYMLPFIVLGASHCLFDSRSVRDAVVLASLFTVTTFATPTLFAFNLASVLFEHPVPLQLLDLSGTSLLLWVIVLTNLLVRNFVEDVRDACQARRRRPSPAAVRNVAAITAIGCLVFGYGAWRLQTADDSTAESPGASLRIAAVQPNMNSAMRPLAVIRDNRETRPYSHIELTRQAIRDHGIPDLVVWPENGMLVRCDDSVVSSAIVAFAASIAVPLMHQCVDCTAGDGRCFNQSRLVDANGNTVARHNKRNLVPVFERRSALLDGRMVRDRARTALTFVADTSEPMLFILDKAAIIPAICFDAQSIGLVREGIEKGGQVLVVQSNDRIFKSSKIGLFDLAINITVAVSLRVAMAKISNSGYGAFMHASGRLVAGSITPVNAVLSSVHSLGLESRDSLYRRRGNWFLPVAALVAAMGALLSCRRRLSRK